MKHIMQHVPIFAFDFSMNKPAMACLIDNELLFYNREIEEYIRNYSLDFKSLELKERIEKQKKFLNKMD